MGIEAMSIGQSRAQGTNLACEYRSVLPATTAMLQLSAMIGISKSNTGIEAGREGK